MNIKGQGHSLSLAKDHSDFKIKTCFSETIRSFETKVHMKAYGGMLMKIYTKEVGHDHNLCLAHVW